MKQLGLTLVVVAVIGLVLGVSTPGVLAATECNDLTTPVLPGSTVNGGLTVGPGDSCTLMGVVVNGGVRMTGGSLEACMSTINGGVRVTAGTCVTLGATLDDLAGCLGNSINGGVGISFVTGGVCPGLASVEVEGNGINGAVKLDNNGTVQVEANTINGSLECSNNFSVTNDGFANTVTGKESGQCAGL